MLGVINFTKNVFFPTKFGVEGRLQSSNSYHMSFFKPNLWGGWAPPPKKKKMVQGLGAPPFPSLQREGGNILIVENNAKFKKIIFFKTQQDITYPPHPGPPPLPHIYGE